MSDDDPDTQASHVREAMGDVVKSLDDPNGDYVKGLRTHLRDLDDVTGGFRKGALIVLGGRPSMDMSTLAINIACRIALGGWDPPRRELARAVLIVTGHGSAGVAGKMLCAYSGVNAHRVRQNRLSEQEERALRSRAADISRAPIYIKSATGLCVDELITVAHRAKERVPDLALIVIDSLSSIEEPEIIDGEQKLGFIIRGLKALARDIQVPVIALTDLRWEMEARDDGFPRLSDLPGEGSIARSADLVILLCDKPLRSRGKPPGEEDVPLLIAKNRYGGTAVVVLHFRWDCHRFEEWSVPVHRAFLNRGFTGA